MTLEQTIARNIRDRLSVLPMLSGVSVVSANDDNELQLPRVVVSATRGGVFVPGHAVYSIEVEIVIRANAWSAASADQATTGNQSVELIYDQVERSLTGDMTELSNGSVAVYGAIYGGAVSDSREERMIERTWSFTLIGAPR